MQFFRMTLLFNRNSFFLIIVCLLVVTASPATAANRALLIGVSDYKHPDIQDLNGVKKDMRIIQDVVRQLGFQDHEVKTLFDSSATLTAIEDSIESWLVSGVNKDDRVLLYFSGHGTQVPDTNDDEADGLDEALVPWDADIQGDAAENVLTDDNFNKMLQRIPARQTIVLIDACHSGTATKGISLIDNDLEVKFLPWPGVSQMGNGRFEVKESGSGLYIALAACRDDELAIANSQMGSYFTLGLQHVVSNNRNKDLTLSQIETKVSSYIKTKLRDTGDKIHHPQISGNKELTSMNMFVRSTDIGSTPDTMYPPLWYEMLELVEMADYSLQLSTDKISYQIGDKLTISMLIKKNGYLNILSIGQQDDDTTLLYPNRFHNDNFVAAGERLSIPEGNEFVLRARAPKGETLTIAVITQEPVNLWKEGFDDSKDIFKSLNSKSFRSFAVEAADSTDSSTDSNTYGSAAVVNQIR